MDMYFTHNGYKPNVLPTVKLTKHGYIHAYSKDVGLVTLCYVSNWSGDILQKDITFHRRQMRFRIWEHEGSHEKP